MPQPIDPPEPKPKAATVTALQDTGSTYNSNNQGFDLDETEYYLILEQGSSADIAALTYGKSSEAATKKNPLCRMTEDTWTVVHDGSYSSTTNLFTHDGKEYVLRLQESSSELYAEAVQV